jgi:tRNA-2-methylthio-N6-dimethylallyladenosine synthase
LQAAIEDHVRQISAGLVNSRQRVLVEGPSRKAGALASELMGRTECNRVVNFPGHPRLIGQMVELRISASLSHTLRGQVLGSESAATLP